MYPHAAQYADADIVVSALANISACGTEARPDKVAEYGFQTARNCWSFTRNLWNFIMCNTLMPYDNENLIP